MFLWLSCVLTHCFVFVCVYHVFLWSHLLVSLGHALLFSSCLVLVSLNLLTWPSCTFLPLFCAVFPFMFAGSSCAIETVTDLLLYIPVLPCHCVSLLSDFFVLFLSNLAYIYCNIIFSCSSVLFLVLNSFIFLLFFSFTTCFSCCCCVVLSAVLLCVCAVLCSGLLSILLPGLATDWDCSPDRLPLEA